MVIIKEAFQSGSSQKIVQKIINVVNKKVSGQILLSDIGYSALPTTTDIQFIKGPIGFIKVKIGTSSTVSVLIRGC